MPILIKQNCIFYGHKSSLSYGILGNKLQESVAYSDEIIEDITCNTSGNLLCTLTDKKLIRVYSLKKNNLDSIEIELQVCFTIPRKATCLLINQALNEDVILVGDKTGEILLYRLNQIKASPNEPKVHALAAHTTSLIQCLTISMDGKYLISCDRDEKIRVSHYPHACQIQSYCLNHSSIVTCVSNVSFLMDTIVSCGEDHLLCLWKASEGKLLDQYEDQEKNFLQVTSTSEFNQLIFLLTNLSIVLFQITPEEKLKIMGTYSIPCSILPQQMSVEKDHVVIQVMNSSSSFNDVLILNIEWNDKTNEYSLIQ